MQDLQQMSKKEEPQEDVLKRYARLDQWFKHPTKRSRKSCWYCKSPGHFKMNCPYIRCWHCHQLGHVKAKCYKKKVEYIYSRLKGDLEFIDKKRKKKNQKRQKLKERKKQIKQIKLRARYSEFKAEGKNYNLFWKEKKVGTYTGNDLPQLAVNKLRENLFDDKQIFALLKKKAPLKSFTLYRGFSNWCKCGEIDLGPDVFADHVKRKHKGIIPEQSQLNRPPWFDFVNFLSEEIEQKYCYTLLEP